MTKTRKNAKTTETKGTTNAVELVITSMTDGATQTVSVPADQNEGTTETAAAVSTDGIAKDIAAAAQVIAEKTTETAAAAPSEGLAALQARLAEKDATEKAAITEIETWGQRVVAAFVKREKDERGWMAQVGALVGPYLSRYIAWHGVSKRKDALNSICGRIMMETGSDYADDVNRCLLIHYVAERFGREMVTALPIQAQRGFALLIKRTESADGRTETYAIPDKIVGHAERLLAYALSDLCNDQVPEHLHSILPRTNAKSKGGKGGWKGGAMADGASVYRLCQRLNDYAKDKGTDPFAAPVEPTKTEAKPQGGTNASADKSGTKTTTTATEATVTKTTETSTAETKTEDVGPALTPATADDKEETTETTETTERRPQDGVTGLPVYHMKGRNPQLVANAIISGLQDADEMGAILSAFGAHDDVNMVFITPILTGMMESKKMAMIETIVKKCAALLKDAKGAK